MGIPKIIHYCWFGHNPKPKLAERCIQSWKKYCPDYEIIEWNEDNYDLSSAPLYVRQAYDAKKWAFVTDYIRLHVVYEHGGIYMDTDVELIKSLNSLLDNKAYFGFETDTHLNTGLGFGAEKHTPILKDIMEDYQNIPFIMEDGSYDYTPCPCRNVGAFIKLGLKQDGTRQILPGDVLILPKEALCPMDYDARKCNITDETYSIHWFSGSWQPKEMVLEEKRMKRRNKVRLIISLIIHIPNWILRKILGDDRYELIKHRIKKTGDS